MSSSTNMSSSIKIPSFIDSASCLCGLLNSQSSLPDNGEQMEMWRCIGDANANINSGGDGKWFNTTQPSEELSGINEPQNWGDNPPDLSQVYVLQNENGKSVYEKLGSGGSASLTGADAGCTGKNDTALSTTYYGTGKPSSNSTMSSSTTSAPSISSTSTANGASVSASSTSPTSTTSSASGTTTPSAVAPKGGPASSTAPHFSLTSALLLAIVSAPLISIFM